VDRAARLLERQGPPRAKIPGCQTRDRPVPGAVGLRDQEDLDRLARRLGNGAALAPAVATHLANTYGARAEAVIRDAAPEDLAPLCPPLPFVWAEVDFNVLDEQALTLEDFFARRTQLLLRDPQGCLEVADAVADRMGALLGWDDATRRTQVAALADEVDATVRCRG
jgi:glycerol-3-phosphate dehydrogenase